MISEERLCFLRAAVKNPLRIGAVAPSSAALARRMLEGLDFRTGEAVVEFGPGTGPFTQLLRRRLPDRGSYIGIERDERFVRMLRERFPGWRFVNDSAEEAERHVAASGHGRVQAIISGLPFASLPPQVQDGVIGCLDRLMEPGTVFRTFQYVHAWPLPSAVRFRRRMERLLGPCRMSRPVMWNLPPAFVLSWQR